MGQSDTHASDDEKQRKLHEMAERFIGVVAGDNPWRAEMARKTLRALLRPRRRRAAATSTAHR